MTPSPAAVKNVVARMSTHAIVKSQVPKTLTANPLMETHRFSHSLQVATQRKHNPFVVTSDTLMTKRPASSAMKKSTSLREEYSLSYLTNNRFSDPFNTVSNKLMR